MALPTIPNRHVDSDAHRQRIAETVNGITSFQFDDSRVRTQAEITALVTPVNLAYAVNHLWRYMTPTQIASAIAGDLNEDATAAFQAALLVGLPVQVPYGVYKITQGLTLNEGGLIGEGWGTATDARKTRLMFYNLTSSTSSALKTRTATYKSGRRVIENIEFLASSWDAVTGCSGYGLDLEAGVQMKNVIVQGFKSVGIFFHGNAAGSDAPYASVLQNVFSFVNGQHGIVIGTNANTITLINCEAKWNGATAYLTIPVVAGSYDGLYMDYQGAGNPGSAYFAHVPEGVSIIGGDCSYNSRYGWNFVACQGGVMTPGYAEGNLQASPGHVNLAAGLSHCFIALGAINGRAAGVNFAAGDSTTIHTNRIFVGGRDCGSGNSNTETSRYSFSIGNKTTWVAYDSSFTNATFMSPDATTGVIGLGAAGTGKWNFIAPIYRSGTQVVNTRVTGYTNAMTGTADRATAYATGTITLIQLAERVKALEDDLIAHGLIGA